MLLLLKVLICIQLFILGCMATLCKQTYGTIIERVQESNDYYYRNRPRFVNKPKTVNITTICTFVELPVRTVYKSEMDPNTDSCENCPEELMIGMSNLSLIPLSAFKNFPSTTTLSMKSNNISVILPGAFNNLNRLRELFLSGNHLVEINDGIFNSLNVLEKLDLSHNKIHNLSLHSFTGSIELQYLNLSSNNLKVFDNSILSYLHNIINIDLSFNELATLELHQLSNTITALNLSHNMIAEISGCISNFREINLSNNRLTRLVNEGNTSCSSESLEKLHASSNLISVLDPQIFLHLPNLIHLDLGNNSISELQIDQFSNIKRIQFLNLSHNHLKNLQYGLFQDLEVLKVLDLSYNRIVNLKKGYLHSLDNLEKLYIDNNRLRVLNAEALLADLPFLKEISIENNNNACEDLIGLVQQFRAREVLVHNGSSKNVSNIIGIPCTNYDETTNKSRQRNEMPDYFNQNFKDRLKYKNISNSNQSEMFEYFDKGFKNSMFYQYLESFRGFHITNSSNEGNNAREDKSVRYNGNDQIYNTEFLITITILLIVLVCLLGLQTYNLRKMFIKTTEHVELMHV